MLVISLGKKHFENNKSAEDAAKIICEDQKKELGRISKNIVLKMRQVDLAYFERHKDAIIFLRFVFKFLTGSFPPDQAIIVPVLARVPAYA